MTLNTTIQCRRKLRIARRTVSFLPTLQIDSGDTVLPRRRTAVRFRNSWNFVQLVLVAPRPWTKADQSFPPDFHQKRPQFRIFRQIPLQKFLCSLRSLWFARLPVPPHSKPDFPHSPAWREIFLRPFENPQPSSRPMSRVVPLVPSRTGVCAHFCASVRLSGKKFLLGGAHPSPYRVRTAKRKIRIQPLSAVPRLFQTRESLHFKRKSLISHFSPQKT
jgi:hypothetical protein